VTALDRLHRAITRRQFDIVAAWSVDRLGRSLQDLVGFLGELHGAGVDLYLDRQGVDTPAGKALFQMLGVFAEFERSIIQERIAAGIARARAKGTRSGKAFGRPKSCRRSARRLYGPRWRPGRAFAGRRGSSAPAMRHVARIAAEMREVNHFRFDPLKRWIKLWETLTPHGEILAVFNSFVTA